ncbi:MAG: hypothetical protein FWH57_13825, partial [Oscillospiraceae bacterium]|nr:hypothetical protein [Oscillospiraceae bacterium]
NLEVTFKRIKTTVALATTPENMDKKPSSRSGAKKPKILLPSKAYHARSENTTETTPQAG